MCTKIDAIRTRDAVLLSPHIDAPAVVRVHDV
jgi:hypothetical protein